MVPRIILTPGEPAGVGPDIILALAEQPWDAELVVIADPELLHSRAKQLGLQFNLIPADFNKSPLPHQPGNVTFVPLKMSAPVQAGQLNPQNAGYVLASLEQAATLCMQGHASAIVTGPVHKAAINEGGFSFSGHTEFFAHFSKVPQTVMLFVAQKLKVALATTHLPLSAVPAAITKAHLTRVIEVLGEGLKKQFNIASPHILICGLNPHAGESGHLGREEIEVITPAIAALKNRFHLSGPLPADTIFTPNVLNKADAVLAMYHDQALPVVKYLDFGNAVNVTLGLPYIRTSVDHGTALDIAGTGTANADSMKAALKLAIELSSPGVAQRA